MLTQQLIKRPARLFDWIDRRPRVVALFSFRYDAHLVPDLLANIEPVVDGWIAYDDRGAREVFSSEIHRRRVLMDAAREMQARWVLAIDPDERLERGAADAIRVMTRWVKPVIWGFHFREMYSVVEYRVDAVWGQKAKYVLFPLLPNQQFIDRPFHSEWCPINSGYKRKQSGLNLYHLKMLSRERRMARRDLYNALDPRNECQQIGYDYLADDTDVVLERIPRGRGFLPAHSDDAGLWMPDMRQRDDRKQSQA